MSKSVKQIECEEAIRLLLEYLDNDDETDDESLQTILDKKA